MSKKIGIQSEPALSMPFKIISGLDLATDQTSQGHVSRTAQTSFFDQDMERMTTCSPQDGRQND
jgi:hypothetical protein